MTKVFPSTHPLVASKLARLRDKRTEPKKFRELVREITGLLAYEATADLRISPKTVVTPMGTAPAVELEEKIGLVPILRAGLGMVEGISFLILLGIAMPLKYFAGMPMAVRVAATLRLADHIVKRRRGAMIACVV